MLREMKIRYVGILVVVAMAAIFFGCDDGNTPKVATSQQMQDVKPIASLPPDGINLSLSEVTLPDYVVASGLGAAEPWGRWSVSDRVVFKFGSNLPEKFALVISAKAFGPNAGLAIPVKVSGQIMGMKLSADSTKDIRMEFLQNTAADSIEITVPKPTVPNNGDVRALGVAFSAVKIEPLP